MALRILAVLVTLFIATPAMAATGLRQDGQVVARTCPKQPPMAVERRCPKLPPMLVALVAASLS